ncbi:MAG TPA: DUF421 domain-containing protein [Clostridia bacterium]|nr:DUF421 domain-containing protein [Clostridia bacterium]
MFGIIEVIIQTLLAFFAILIYARILGKQQIGQLTFFEYINGITFGSIAAVLATDIGPRSTLYNMLGLSLFALLTFLGSYVSMKSRALRKVIAGEPTVVIHNGKILEDNIHKLQYNIDELLVQLREKGVFDIGDVEFAILEPTGALSVQVKSQAKPVTREDLNIPSEYEGVSVELVMDGEVIHQNLRQIGLDEKWLLDQLKQRGVTSLNEVPLAVIASNGELYVDLTEDKLGTTIDITDNPEPPDG